MTTPLQIASAFVRLINSHDVGGITNALTDDSRFFVEGEPPTVGRGRLREAWAGYFDGFPDYAIFIDEAHERADAVYLLGHTAGSHVSEDLECVPSSVIWRCVVAGGQVAEWSIHPGTEANRERFGLDAPDA